VAAHVDPAGNVKPDKSRSAHRIDPIVALVMAVDRWQRFAAERPGRSVYEDRGLVVAT
jgi:phage terminase large subunit-like protein